MFTASDGRRILLECGIQWAKLQKALDFDLSGIVACFISHCHADHSKAAGDIVRAGIDVYTSAGTLDAITLDGHRRTKTIEDKTLVRLGNGLEVYAFGVNHDAPEPLGFVIRDNDAYLLFATDTAYIKQRFAYPFSIVMLECSYDKEILETRVHTGDIDEKLAKRLLTSHMERQNTIKYLADFCDLSRCQEIHLLHLSSDNIDKEQVRKEVEERFFIKTRIVGYEVQGKNRANESNVGMERNIRGVPQI